MTEKEKLPELTAEEVEEEKSKYTRKMYTPIYEPTGAKPDLKDLFCTEKRDELINEINSDDNLDEEMKQFLRSAAERHTAFDYGKIAEFYSHLPIQYKSHFENSALVIIDYDKAVRNGFIAYDKEVQESRIDYLENILTTENLAEIKDEIAKKRIRIAEEELEHLKSGKVKLQDDLDEDWE